MKQVASSAVHWETVFQNSAYSAVPDEGVRKSLGKATGFLSVAPDKTLLDLGCGGGWTSIFWARTGMRVTAVDSSPTAIARLRAKCEEEGITNLTAVVGDAMEIDQLGPFDYVYGSMILHHLEPFQEFAARLKQLLRPGGKAFFYENNGASALLIWCRTHLVGRFGIPKHGDADEFPLTPQEIDVLRSMFQVKIQFPALVFFELASVYLLRRRFMLPLRAIDNFLYNRKIGVEHSYRQYVLLERRLE